MSDPYDGLPGGPLPEGGSNIVQFPSHSGAGGGGENSDPPTPPSAPREIAKRLYLALRTRGGASASMEGVERALATHRDRLPPEAPPADRDLLLAWAREDDWEGRYRASQSVVVLDSREADPRRYLSDLLRQREAARGVMESLTEQVEGPPPDHYNEIDKGPWPNAGVVHRWQSAQQNFISISRAVSEAQEGVVRADREGTRDDYWEGEYESTRARLREHYSGGGPQYDILVDRLASLDVRLRQMERSGRDVPPDEYKTLHDLHLKYTAQVQRHTESLKSESIQPVQDAIKKLVSICERRIRPASASLWSDLVEDIVQAVGEMGAA